MQPTLFVVTFRVYYKLSEEVPKVLRPQLEDEWRNSSYTFLFFAVSANYSSQSDEDKMTILYYCLDKFSLFLSFPEMHEDNLYGFIIKMEEYCLGYLHHTHWLVKC